MSEIVVKFNKLPQIPAELRSRAGKAVSKAAHAIEAIAKANAPVDTGFLRNSIQAEQEAAFNWRVVVGAEYGAYQEYGTSKMPAHPYLTPAAEIVRPQFIDEMESFVRESTG